MKKIVTLLIAVGSFIAVNAQSRDEARRVILGAPKNDPQSTPSQNPRDVILGGGGNNGTNYPNSYPGNYPNGSGSTSADRVNREYNAKIQSIRNNPYLSQAEKDRAIRQLESDRARRLRQINGQYARNHRDYKDDDYKYKGKGNNGKHKGWTKGKGNKKKYKDRHDD
jgi:hypothetical protein